MHLSGSNLVPEAQKRAFPIRIMSHCPAEEETPGDSTFLPRSNKKTYLSSDTEIIAAALGT